MICEIYISSFKVNLVLQIAYLSGLVFFSRNMISIGFLKTITPILIVFFIGFIGFLIHPYAFSDASKDLSYFLKPIIGLLLSYFVFKKYDDVNVFCKAILFVGLFTSSVHLFGILFFGNFLSASISNLRGNFGFDNFIEIFSFFILLFSNKFSEKPYFKKLAFKRLALAMLLLSIIIYFSRTMFVALFIIGFSVFGLTKITSKTLKILATSFVLAGLFYAYLFSVKIDRNSDGLEGFLYKIKIAPEEIFKTKVNRENHDELWDHWRGYEANRASALMEKNPSSYVVGMGYGSLVNLKFQAPLGENGTMKFISKLHNGYMFVIYKTGIIGFVLYFMFFLNFYMKIYNKGETISNDFIYRFISAVGLFYLFSSLIISGIYVAKDTVIFILGGFLAFENRSFRISK